MPMRPPIAFMSYARFDDDHNEGYLTQFRQRLSGEVQAHTGKPFPIFQDRTHIQWGEEWASRIEETIRSVTFLLPILTPSFFRSPACRRELEAFLAHERRLGRCDLILPIYYLECRELEDASRRVADPLANALITRQHVNWRELRHKRLSKPKVARCLAEMALRIRDALEQVAPDSQASPELVVPPEIKIPLSANDRNLRPKSKSPGLKEEILTRASAPPDFVSTDRLTVLQNRWESDPSSRIFLQLAEEYRNLGRHHEALEVLDRGLREHPAYLSALVSKARCHLEMGHPATARDVLERVVRQDATQMVASKLLAKAYIEMNEPKLALERLRLYALLNAEDPEIKELQSQIVAADSPQF